MSRNKDNLYNSKTKKISRKLFNISFSYRIKGSEFELKKKTSGKIWKIKMPNLEDFPPRARKKANGIHIEHVEKTSRKN